MQTWEIVALAVVILAGATILWSILRVPGPDKKLPPEEEDRLQRFGLMVSLATAKRESRALSLGTSMEDVAGCVLETLAEIPLPAAKALTVFVLAAVEQRWSRLVQKGTDAYNQIQRNTDEVRAWIRQHGFPETAPKV